MGCRGLGWDCFVLGVAIRLQLMMDPSKRRRIILRDSSPQEEGVAEMEPERHVFTPNAFGKNKRVALASLPGSARQRDAPV